VSFLQIDIYTPPVARFKSEHLLAARPSAGETRSHTLRALATVRRTRVCQTPSDAMSFDVATKGSPHQRIAELQPAKRSPSIASTGLFAHSPGTATVG
jgi:hypothetical protein